MLSVSAFSSTVDAIKASSSETAVMREASPCRRTASLRCSFIVISPESCKTTPPTKASYLFSTTRVRHCSQRCAAPAGFKATARMPLVETSRRCTGQASTNPARLMRLKTESDSSRPSAASAASTAALKPSHAACASSSVILPTLPTATLRNLVLVLGSESARDRSFGLSHSCAAATLHHLSRLLLLSNSVRSTASSSPAPSRVSNSILKASVGPYAGTDRRPAGFSTTTTELDMASTRIPVACSSFTAASRFTSIEWPAERPATAASIETTRCTVDGISGRLGCASKRNRNRSGRNLRETPWSEVATSLGRTTKAATV
mmetsp:Transcript_10928/g.36500  ORF Transcript_10928/g.36500 Transcript_10928/m.36500 type:complete len:319 (+) Transcript_10928:1629-2585(+)